MSNIPTDLLYTKSHEWIRKNADGSLTIGITDHAQAALGDIVFVELPDVGSSVNAGEDICVVESVKAASDIYSPYAGEVSRINTALEDEPEAINNNAYESWLVELTAVDFASNDSFMDNVAYAKMLEDEN